MKPTTIAKSALALALGMVACAASASLTENFESFNLGTTIAGTTNNSLGWASSGTADLSYVTNNIMGDASNKALKVATEGDTLSATIQGEEATSLNAALAGGKAVTFTCNANLEPTDDLESISGSDLKFALYAYAHGTPLTTNLVVYGYNTTLGYATNNVTDIVIDGGTTNIEVTITQTAPAVNEFYVVVGVSTSATYRTVSSTPISQLDISGNGAIDNIAFTYAPAGNAYNEDDKPLPLAPTHELTDAEAIYLNAVLGSGDKNTLDGYLATMTEDEFNEAFKLNTSILADQGAADYSFDITSIVRDGSDIVVTITLTRENPVGAVRGTLTFQTSANGEDWGAGTSVDLDTSSFGAGKTTTATATFPKSGNANFFKAKIQ